MVSLFAEPLFLNNIVHDLGEVHVVRYDALALIKNIVALTINCVKQLRRNDSNSVGLWNLSVFTLVNLLKLNFCAIY